MGTVLREGRGTAEGSHQAVVVDMAVVLDMVPVL